MAVIGDGSMTGGMAYEALNNVSHLKSNMIIVLNDNKMSISENVGGLSRHLTALRTRESYMDFKVDVEKKLKRFLMWEILWPEVSRNPRIPSDNCL